MRAARPPDPVRLVYAAPVISPGEDWRQRSLWSWIILARHKGLDVEATDRGGRGFPATWCGNVLVDGLVYRVHRAPRLRIRTLEANGHPGWLLHAATYVEPITSGVEVLDPRQDRDEPLPDASQRAGAPRHTSPEPTIHPDVGP
jgi:hypothetical protein